MFNRGQGRRTIHKVDSCVAMQGDYSYAQNNGNEYHRHYVELTIQKSRGKAQQWCLKLGNVVTVNR